MYVACRRERKTRF